MKQRKVVDIICICVVLFVALIFARFLIRLSREGGRSEAIEQNGQYNVTVDGMLYENVSLSGFEFETAKKGTVISYETVLQGDTIDSPEICIYMTHCRVHAYLDGEEVFAYGDSEKYMWGYGYFNIPLPADYQGRSFRVDMTVMESGEVSSVYAPVIYNGRYHMKDYLIQNILVVFVDFPLIVLSITIMMVAIFFMGRMPILRRLIWLALAFFCMGLWEMCNHDIIWLFTDSLKMRGYVEYLSLYSASSFLMMYFFEDFYLSEKSRRRYVYMGLLIADVSFVILCFILHFTGLVHLPEMLMVSHLLMVASIVFIMSMLVREVRSHTAEHRSMMIGFIIVILLGISDILQFNFRRYFMKSSNVHYTSYLMLGIYIFTITMLIDYFKNQSKHLVNQTEKDTLKKLAYTDMMTGLLNRRGCEREFELLQVSSEPYVIISCDVNNLKLTNDTYGHLEGDKLLTDFSDLLKSAFGEDGSIGRMGGDEFVVILRGAAGDKIDKLIEMMKLKQKEINETRIPLPLEFAYGYCGSDEEDGAQVVDVYRVADSRMYKLKQEMKDIA